jgi:hypothetical protein
MKNPFRWLVLFASLSGGLVEARASGTWEKLADPPKDVAGRECSPGMDGAWVYVPAWKGFLLYGGCSPTYSNEGWFFDPDKKEWTLLWAHDGLAFDKEKKQWRVLMPRDLVWSLDRPGPARGQAAIAVGDAVYLFGGHPSVEWKIDGRHRRSDFFGATRLGTWKLSAGTGKFEHIGNDGPKGMVRAVYDPANNLIVTAPALVNTEAVMHVLSPRTSKWEARKVEGGPQPTEPPCWAYDSRIKKCVYWSVEGKTWSYDVGKNQWQDLNPGQAPSPRHHAGLCFDEASGLTILQGGVVYPRDVVKQRPHAFWPDAGGVALDDTWAYDGVKNEWRELRPTTAPLKIHSARDMIAYDSDRRSPVLYDVSSGVWAWRNGKEPAINKGLSVPLPRLSVKEPPSMQVKDQQIEAWQGNITKLADDAWVEAALLAPTLGCESLCYDAKNHCLTQVGGCGGALFSTRDDNGYHNQVWLLDMDVGRYVLRRAHHQWRPHGEGVGDLRVGSGCTRSFCFDPVREVLWLQGSANYGWKGGMNIRTYDVAKDAFGPGGAHPGAVIGQGDQIICDSKHDLVLWADTWHTNKTYLYDPKTNKWSNGGPCPPLDKKANGVLCNVARVYDPQLGVLMVMPSDGVMKTFVYDVPTRKWRDLAPKGGETVPWCDQPGICYDSRNRALICITSGHSNPSAAPPGTMRILDLATNTWKEGAAAPVRANLNHGAATYDANHNLVICKFGGNQRFWFYRYRGGTPAGAFAEN